MICPECNGMGETLYYVEIDRDENKITVEQRKDICRTCNGSGEVQMTNADRIRAMSEEELATFINRIVIFHQLRNEGNCEKCPIHPAKPCDTEGIAEWLKQPAEEDDQRRTERRC